MAMPAHAMHERVRIVEVGPRDGTVAEVRAAAGDFVEADAVLVTLES